MPMTESSDHRFVDEQIKAIRFLTFQKIYSPERKSKDKTLQLGSAQSSQNSMQQKMAFSEVSIVDKQ